ADVFPDRSGGDKLRNPARCAARREKELPPARCLNRNAPSLTSLRSALSTKAPPAAQIRTRRPTLPAPARWAIPAQRIQFRRSDLPAPRPSTAPAHKQQGYCLCPGKIHLHASASVPAVTSAMPNGENSQHLSKERN